jgi:hypothetical protein
LGEYLIFDISLEFSEVKGGVEEEKRDELFEKRQPAAVYIDFGNAPSPHHSWHFCSTGRCDEKINETGGVSLGGYMSRPSIRRKRPFK